MDKDELERRFAKLPVFDPSWFESTPEPDFHLWKHVVLQSAVHEGCSAWWIGENYSGKLRVWYDDGVIVVIAVARLSVEQTNSSGLPPKLTPTPIDTQQASLARRGKRRTKKQIEFGTCNANNNEKFVAVSF